MAPLKMWAWQGWTKDIETILIGLSELQDYLLLSTKLWGELNYVSGTHAWAMHESIDQMTFVGAVAEYP